ncbi:hypothetical protein AMTRI_Chr09g34950 [Amborella trichopoda]|uniref:glutathione transferase n=1 Tax=Amborella trichopoda TaxID=13333 RepID=W1NM30_AMBTC|nr:glutathione S-transferase F11-like [Amborella trichopoda]ERM96285.1 hypothetical protein AMTR_s00001p00173570 [Amborella trichopoda]|eukprot:XP_020517142.1 glutathione S-transferase F11-like [Amborella trichopoda]
MAAVKVFGPPMSTAVARVLACLYEKQAEFELVRIDMSKGQHKKPEYLAIQPFGQVPAFQDENVILLESRAISRYIVDKYQDQGTPGLLGSNFIERASIDQWIEAEAQSFQPPSGALVFQLFFAPLMGLKTDKVIIDQNQAKLEKVLDIYEKMLEENRFLAGDRFTLADLTHLPNCEYLVQKTDRSGLILGRKNVRRWWEEISSRPAWKKVVELQVAPPK